MSEHICRRLILFLDGTWNEDEESRPATNIVYLRERLFWGLSRRLRKIDEDRRKNRDNADAIAFSELPDNFKRKGVSGVVLDGFEYIAYYDRGVGTGPFWDAVKGGVFGVGLDQNIRQAYRFLSSWYRPGDEIFVFGFSRGAYTARSLCGYLQAVGLLRREHCTAENEARGWRYYRTPPGDRLSGEWQSLQRASGISGEPTMHDSRFMRVRALSVFDTVGALGIPAEGFRRLNRSKYEFHDTDLNSLVDIRLHALALDEPRHAFAPTLWTRPKFKRADLRKSPTEQVWFPGAHADIGGGYVKWNQNEPGLSYLPLAWMIQRLDKFVKETPPIAEPMLIEPAVEPERDAPIPFFKSDLLTPEGAIDPHLYGLALYDQHKPWAAASIVRADNSRIINQLPLPHIRSMEASGRVPYADPIGEMVHVAALERLNKTVRTEKDWFMNFVGKFSNSGNTYQPYNLISVIPYLAASYIRLPGMVTPWRDIVKPIFTWKESRIVGWDGQPLDPRKKNDVQRAFALLPAPEQIGVTKMPEEMEFIHDPRTASGSP